MDGQNGWIVVEFCDDESVEVVPDFWLTNNSCAWPKASKQAKRYIQKRIEPDSNDFIFYKSRMIGHKIYSSYNEAKMKLPTAVLKSDLSSADDIVLGKRKRKLKGQSLSPNVIVKTKKIKDKNVKKAQESYDSCPPRYSLSKPFCSNEYINVIEPSDNSSTAYDSDKDPLWKISNYNSKYRGNTSSFDDINCFTPEKHTSVLSDIVIENKQIISSPVGIWTVERDYDKAGDNNKIKKVLFNDQNVEYSKIETVNNTETDLKRSQESNIVQSQLDITKDFQRFITNTMVIMKYDIGSILSIVQTNSININTLIANNNTSSYAKNIINLDQTFPIKSNDELDLLEDKTKSDEGFKNTLVTQLSMLVDNNDLGNTVRRIVARMFSDVVLSNYSLFGFKSKLCFSSLQCYRIIIDAIRVNAKYSITPEKDIDNALGIWLSHAPFRLKKLSLKKEKLYSRGHHKTI